MYRRAVYFHDVHTEYAGHQIERNEDEGKLSQLLRRLGLLYGGRRVQDTDGAHEKLERVHEKSICGFGLAQDLDEDTLEDTIVCL